MSKHHSHINSAIAVLSGYEGKSAFSYVLKAFFRENKKYGSKDRKQISNLCYSYFRAVRVLDSDMGLEDKITLAYFLCNTGDNYFIGALKPEWLPDINLSIRDKFEKFGLDVQKLFPQVDALEEGIDKTSFSYSHFTQPDLFLRIRPNQEERVKNKLTKAGFEFKQLEAGCLALPNTSQLRDVLKINKEAVVQDYSSQRVGGLFDRIKSLLPAGIKKPKVWDCCVASGGKTILAVDRLGETDLTLSDVRPTMIQNLKERLREAQIGRYSCHVLDLTDTKNLEVLGEFDIIIADVPCSGSGTWGRNPENLLHFDTNEIERYAELQKTIVQNVQTKLSDGGFLVYITCSVYGQENSGLVSHLIANTSLKLIESQVLLGESFRSDSMFVALLRKGS